MSCQNMKMDQTFNRIQYIRNFNNSETSAIANERIPKEEMVLKSSGNSWVEIEDLMEIHI